MRRLFTLLVFCCLLGSPSAKAENTTARRIVSLAPHLTELVFSAGAGRWLVGAVSYSDYPAAARKVPRIGDAFQVDYEAIVGLRPDLILAWEGGNPAQIIERLRGLGLQVETFAPLRLEDVAAHLRRIGDLTGQLQPANEHADRYLEVLTGLRREYSRRSPVRVFYQISFEPLYTVGGRSYITQMIELCGGHNVFEGIRELAAVVGIEAVLERDPELIIAGLDSVEDLATEWSRWRDIAAVATNNLAVVDPSLTGRASLRLMDGARQICTALDKARRTQVDSPPSR